MHIRHLESTDREALVAFLERVPEADQTFFKEDVADPSVIDRWMHPGPVRAVAIEYAEIVDVSRSSLSMAGQATWGNCAWLSIRRIVAVVSDARSHDRRCSRHSSLA